MKKVLGFTLTEIMVTLAILSILAAIAFTLKIAPIENGLGLTH